MPRDTTGQYTLPLPPVFPGDVIESDWANTTLNDLAIALTDSLSRTGAGGLLVPFQVADGTVGAPGLAFANEPTSGLYRSAINTWGLVVAGVERIRLQGSAVSVLTPTLRIQDGTVAAPGLSFASEPNSGLYRSAAKTWGLVVDGFERVRLDPDAVTVYGTPLRLTDGLQGAPSLSFMNETNSGIYRNDTNSWCLVVAANQRLMVTLDYLRAFVPVLLQDGVPILPALTFASETTLGIYRSAAGTLSVATNGVERLRVQGGALSVYGDTIRLADASQPPDNRYFKIATFVGRGFVAGGLPADESAFREWVSFDASGGVIRAGSINGFRVTQFDISGANDLLAVGNSYTDVMYPPGGVNQKNFRIGWVVGNYFVGTLDDAKSTYLNYMVFRNTESLIDLSATNGIRVNSGGGNLFAVKNDHVEVNTSLRMPNNVAITFRTTTGLDWNFAYSGPQNQLHMGSWWSGVHLYTNGVERMHVTQLGGVKMTNAGGYQQPGGSAHEMYSNDSTYACLVTNSNASPFGLQSFFPSLAAGSRSGGNYHFSAWDAGGAVFYVYSNGGVVNYTANNVSLCDENAKRMIGDSPDYTDQIERLAFRRFSYKDAPDDDVVDDITAQDVEQFAPDLVTDFGDSGLKGVYTHRLQNRINSVVPKLIVRMKQMAARIKALEDRE